MQKKQSKWLIATVVLTLVLSFAQPITFAAAAPFVISATPQSIEIYEGDSIDVTLSTLYDYDLDWTATSSIGSISLDPARTLKGNHSTVATFTSMAPGTGQITIKATSTINRYKRATLIIPVKVLVDVPEPTDLAPVNLEAPVITPVAPAPALGSIMTATPGSWTDDSTSQEQLIYSYQWLANDIQILDANLASYTVTADDQGKAIVVKVTVRDTAGNQTSALSNGVVVPDVTPPESLEAPVLSGTFFSGELLTVSTGNWMDHTALTYSYQWFKNDTLLENETANTYQSTLSGNNIYVIVTATDAYGNSVAIHSNTAIISDKPIPVTRDYLSLGDSIAVGYTALNGNKYSFSDQFYYKNIAVESPGSRYYDLSENGLDSRELYEKFDGLGDDSVYIDAIINAEVITICIGGNDILDTVTRSFQTVNYPAALIGIQDFAIYWPLIIDRINELNSEARIIAVELYNPYMVIKPSGYSGDPAFDVIDKYVHTNDDLAANGINETMWLYKTVKNYDMVSIHDVFKTTGTKNLTYFYPSSLFKFMRDPHPKQAGQDLIYNQLIQVY